MSIFVERNCLRNLPWDPRSFCPSGLLNLFASFPQYQFKPRHWSCLNFMKISGYCCPYTLHPSLQPRAGNQEHSKATQTLPAAGMVAACTVQTLKVSFTSKSITGTLVFGVRLCLWICQAGQPAWPQKVTLLQHPFVCRNKMQTQSLSSAGTSPVFMRVEWIFTPVLTHP